MKRIQNLLFGILSLISTITVAQSSKDLPPKLIDRIVGTWQIQKVLDGNKDITPDKTITPKQIKFDLEGHYKSSVGTMVLDSGSYRISESAGLLYLENKKAFNAANLNSNQETWSISFKNDTMTLRGQGNEALKKIRYVYEKQD